MHLQSVYFMLFHTTYCLTYFGSAEPSSGITKTGEETCGKTAVNSIVRI